MQKYQSSIDPSLVSVEIKQYPMWDYWTIVYHIGKYPYRLANYKCQTKTKDLIFIEGIVEDSEDFRKTILNAPANYQVMVSKK